jgi:4-diphosphocytidyl-2-C-methyl-D-erythritol kinase
MRAHELAQLGSDCAFFAAARSSGLARCTGRGERVESLPAPAPPWTIVVLVPALGTSTREVYAALDSPLSPRGASPTVPLAVFTEPASRARSRLFNDLEEAASRVLPEWTKWREALDSVGASHFRLSGSGSSFFGLFDEEEEARSMLVRLRHAVAARGLQVRGGWVTRPSGRGVQPIEILVD